jgi:hypothetical protein
MALDPRRRSIYGDPYGQNTLPETNPNPEAPMQNRYVQNQNLINAQGTELNNEAIDAEGYYGGLTPGYQEATDTALSDLNDTPGYTGDEADRIGLDYSQFNSSPDELAAIRGNPDTAWKVMNNGIAGEGAMLNQYQGNLGGQVGNYAKDVGGATDAYGNDLGGAVGRYGGGVTDAVGDLRSGLDKSQNFSKLDAAVNRPDLAFDPNATEKQLSDADVQEMKTSAGTRVGNQYRNAEDTLERQAAEAGNTSPLALAAARARLQTQESADQGDAETNADIAAKQAQFGRAQGIEAQREGAVQTQAGMQATAGTTEEGAAQAAAGLAGTTGVQAAKDIGATGVGAAQDFGHTRVQSAKDVGAQGIDAAHRYGQFSTTTQGDIANKGYTAANAADTNASNRAAATTGIRYGQGTNSAQLTSGGAQTTGNARMAGKQAYRSGLQGQEQFAQTGGNQAHTQQNQTYATQTNGLNGSAAAQGNFINGKASFGDSLASGFAKNLTGLLGFGGGGAAKGDVITHPEIRTIGEAGPELVIQLPRYRGQRREDDPAFQEAA